MMSIVSPNMSNKFKSVVMIIDERELQKTTKEKQAKTERTKGNRSYGGKVRAK